MSIAGGIHHKFVVFEAQMSSSTEIPICFLQKGQKLSRKNPVRRKHGCNYDTSFIQIALFSIMGEGDDLHGLAFPSKR